MTDRYFNPFQTTDIIVPSEFHDAFGRYCQRDSKENLDHSPFPRMIDLWFLSLCVAVRSNINPKDASKIKSVKIIDGSIFGSDPWRVHMLMMVAVAKSGDVKIVSEPNKMIRIANGLAAAGLPKVIEMLQNGSAEPIWNISEAITSLINNDQLE